tara:strand:- start:2121 stop:2231 length:111 start_codon:yes stop_codon:yes gene_type:complete
MKTLKINLKIYNLLLKKAKANKHDSVENYLTDKALS